MDLLVKAIGVWLFFDGVLSLFLCADKKWHYQLVRVIRALIGIGLLFIR